MRILKRDKTTQAFMPNKILTRIKTQAVGLEIDADILFQEVIPLISDNNSTTEIDEIIAFKAADKIINHPDYSILGGRILLSRQSKLIGKPLQDVDMTFDFFAATTFLKKYSMKDAKSTPLELPSCMYERVAKHLYGDDQKEIDELLVELKSKRINFSTPILSNGGIENRGGMISCNLVTLLGDSISEIEETLTKLAFASKEGAGIGLLVDCLRSKESKVSSFNGNASGVVRLADMVQSKMRFYKQGDRSGSCAMYMSLWHRDIIDFLKLTLPNGDEALRTRDLFTGAVINDLFMNKLIHGEDWYTFCPNDILKAGLRPFQDLWGSEFEEEYQKAVELGIGKKVNPKDIWDAVITSQVESGKPYVLFKDNANKRNMQSNIGIINMSNLCVSDNTILDILINGEESQTDIKTVVKMVKDGLNVMVKSYNHETGTEEYKIITNGALMSKNSEVLEIIDNDSGKSVLCTPSHKIFTKNRGYIMAKDLEETDVLVIAQ